MKRFDKYAWIISWYTLLWMIIDLWSSGLKTICLKNECSLIVEWMLQNRYLSSLTRCLFKINKKNKKDLRLVFTRVTENLRQTSSFFMWFLSNIDSSVQMAIAWMICAISIIHGHLFHLKFYVYLSVLSYLLFFLKSMS